MALKGTTNEERIWNFCIGKGMSKCGAAGLMGNIYAESGLVPTNLQNSFEKKLGYTDAAYTAAVDNGSYKNFVRDSAGYGLCPYHLPDRSGISLYFPVSLEDATATAGIPCVLSHHRLLCCGVYREGTAVLCGVLLGAFIWCTS